MVMWRYERGRSLEVRGDAYDVVNKVRKEVAEQERTWRENIFSCTFSSDLLDRGRLTFPYQLAAGLATELWATDGIGNCPKPG